VYFRAAKFAIVNVVTPPNPACSYSVRALVEDDGFTVCNGACADVTWVPPNTESRPRAIVGHPQEACILLPCASLADMF